MRIAVLTCLVVVGLWAPLASAEVRSPTHVACVGDSITEGYMVDAMQSYPAQLQALLGAAVQVGNFGKGGATALRSGFGDLPYDQQAQYTAALDFVSNAGPGAVVSVIIMLGANDSKPMNWSPQGDEAGKPRNDQQYLTDYTALVDRFLGLATKPVVYVALPLSSGNAPCCSIRPDVVTNEILPLLTELSMARRLPTIDLHTPTAGHPEYFLDGVHPNAAAYTIVASAMKAGLEQDFDYASIVPPVGGSGAGGSAGTGGTGGSSPGNGGTLPGNGGNGGSPPGNGGNGGSSLGTGGSPPGTAGAAGVGGGAMPSAEPAATTDSSGCCVGMGERHSTLAISFVVASLLAYRSRKLSRAAFRDGWLRRLVPREGPAGRVRR